MDAETVVNAPEETNGASVPVSDWKSRRLKVGHHIKNARGQIGVVTWISGGHYCYRLGTRELNGH